MYYDTDEQILEDGFYFDKKTYKQKTIVENNNIVKYYLITLLITSLILLMMGRPFYCVEHDIYIYNSINGHLSQHLFDIYSFTHLLHGVVFYTFMSYIKLKIHNNLTYAIALTCIWEIIENTTFFIDIYRTDNIHIGYYGDSITNSIGDIVSCIIGWHVSKYIGNINSIILYLIIECTLLVLIEDNLTKNILMFMNIIQSFVFLFLMWYMKCYFLYTIEMTIWKKIKSKIKFM
jgi:hypothetical protein